MSIARGNLRDDLPDFDDVSRRGSEEQFVELARGRHARVERIVSWGQSSPEDFWYDQEEDEYVLVVEGAAELELEGGERVRLSAGDWIEIPAHLRHRVAWTRPDGPTIWLAVFFT
ncbi:MAG: cupin domain-containing protein [Myxococcales bacterium]|jgi:cupin 2 domain-containing protein|nr:cupin domain-containing protein [Myxococcales bacterium]